MYKLGLCELHCYKLHGGDKNLGHYLLMQTYADLHSIEDAEEEGETDEEEWDTDEDEGGWTIFDEADDCNSYYLGELANTKHSFIRNYSEIIKGPNYIKPEILSVVHLETGETVAILKTFWLRIFQRTWRRNFAKRLSALKNIHNIHITRLTGRMPMTY